MINPELSLAFCRQLLTKVSYHGMEFRIDGGRFLETDFDHIAQITIIHRVVDAETLKPNIITHSFNTHIASFRNPDDFYRWVWDCVRQRVIHEAQEFFLVDGVRVNDPYKHDKMANSLK